MNLLDLARSALPEPSTSVADGPIRPWRIRYQNGAAMTVLFTPAATRAEVADLYPGASIEPVQEAPARAAPPAEAAELRELVNIVLADASDDERAEALAVAVADPNAALASLRAVARARRPKNGRKRWR